jgi:uncharacterized membrane protein
MKKIGYVLAVLGVIACLISVNLDPTRITYGHGFERLSPYELMNDRTNYVIISCFMVLIGVILIVFGKEKAVAKVDHD